MMNFLRRCRRTDKMLAYRKKVAKTIAAIVFGLLFGLLAEWSSVVVKDGTFIGDLFTALDLGNFMSRMGFWVIMSVIFTIDAESPLKAAVNVLLFLGFALLGRLGYSYLILHNELVINYYSWGIYGVVSAILALVLWYSKGEGWFSVFNSAFIIGFFISMAFDYGTWYIEMTFIPEIIILGLSVILMYQNISKIFIELFYSLSFAILFELFLPYIGL